MRLPAYCVTPVHTITLVLQAVHQTGSLSCDPSPHHPHCLCRPYARQAAHLVADLPRAARHLPLHIHAQQRLLLAQAAQLRQHLQWVGGVWDRCSRSANIASAVDVEWKPPAWPSACGRHGGYCG